MCEQEQKINEALSKLRDKFYSVLDYIGDNELISNCNAEYQLSRNDWFMTDGIANVMPGGPDSDNRTTVCVRGATHVIVCMWKKETKTVRRVLYINRNAVLAAYDLILAELERQGGEPRDDMIYYIDEWSAGAAAGGGAK